MPTKREIERNWSDRAKRYGYDAVGVIGTKGAVQREQYKKTLAFLDGKLPKDKTVLDYGCGVGKLSVLFDPKLYIGVDICSEMIQIARKRHPEYTFEEISKLPVTDIIFTGNVLQHNPNELVTKMKFRAADLYLYEITGSVNNKPHLYYRSPEDYARLLKRDIIKVWPNGTHNLIHLR